jgi:phosphinothricin acetyltransferase
MGLDLAIETLTARHWAAVCSIYLEGIASRNATFETEAPRWEVWDSNHLPVCRFVAVFAADVVGWSALSPVSRRAAYRGVAEVSVYVTESHHGKGVGRRLLAELIRAAENAGIWTLQASVFPENHATIRLHEAAGFRTVGRRERIAQLDGVWRDTLLLERRSSTVGIG